VSIKYLVDENLIPNDGSKEIIDNFYTKTNDKDLELLIYPDVHYKKGARVVNGMLTASDISIYPAMLGVANCGFTFGRVKNISIDDRETLEKSFEEYSKVLKAYNGTYVYEEDEIYNLFDVYLEKFYKDEKYKYLFEFVDISSLEDLQNSVKEVLTQKQIDTARKTLGTLGGGNHFFELQYVEENYNKDFKEGEIIFILHSDSIAVGDRINLLFSNLSELDHLKLKPKGELIRLLNRFRQIEYFMFQNKLLWQEPKEVLNLLFSQNDFRTINANTMTGKTLIKAFFLASIFGDMNRDMILKNYEKIAKNILDKLELEVLGSHSHDSLMVERYDDKYKIVQRNGVQRVKEDKYFVLPGALGTESYIMQNPSNKEAFFSANHGVGRFLDKHIAKKEFSSKNTEEELKRRGMKLYRVGTGNISEQNPNAFKDVFKVTEIMKKENLGDRVAKLRPVCSMKG